MRFTFFFENSSKFSGILRNSKEFSKKNLLTKIFACQVSVEIEDVQRKPRNAENECYAYQQAVGALHSAASSALNPYINSRDILGDNESLLESKINFHVGGRDDQYRDEVLKGEGEERVINSTIEIWQRRPVFAAVRNSLSETHF